MIRAYLRVSTDQQDVRCPAPSVAETLEEIDHQGCPTVYYHNGTWHASCYQDRDEGGEPDVLEESADTPQDAALKLWLKLRRGKE